MRSQSTSAGSTGGRQRHDGVLETNKPAAVAASDFADCLAKASAATYTVEVRIHSFVGPPATWSFAVMHT